MAGRPPIPRTAAWCPPKRSARCSIFRASCGAKAPQAVKCTLWHGYGDAACASAAQCQARLSKKPWEHDPWLRETFETLVTGPSSVTRLIAGSSDFKKVLNEHIREQRESHVDGRRVRDLHYAKQRFDSTQKPLGRWVLWLDAILATAHEICIRRAGRLPARQAVACLDFITEESHLQAIRPFQTIRPFGIHVAYSSCSGQIHDDYSSCRARIHNAYSSCRT